MVDRNKIQGRYSISPKAKGKFFIIGLRRSGTSILRNLVLRSPAVKEIMFEPHELFQAISVLKIGRYKNSKYHRKVVGAFEALPRWSGAKFALNPGIDAMEWVWLGQIFPNAKFIFIVRNPKSTFNSYIKADKNTLRGIITWEIYRPFYDLMVDKFNSFDKKRSVVVSYDKILKNVDPEMKKIWGLLDIKSPGSLRSFIKTPQF